MAGGAQSIAKACAGPHLPILQPPKTIQGILPGGVESSACPAMASAEKQLHCGADYTLFQQKGVVEMRKRA